MKILPCNSLHSNGLTNMKNLDSNRAICKVGMYFQATQTKFIGDTIVCQLYLCPEVFGNQASITGNYFV